jgi:hypothetical protein
LKRTTEGAGRPAQARSETMQSSGQGAFDALVIMAMTE